MLFITKRFRRCGNATVEILYVFSIVAALIMVFVSFFRLTTKKNQAMFSLAHKGMIRLRNEELKRW